MIDRAAAPRWLVALLAGLLVFTGLTAASQPAGAAVRPQVIGLSAGRGPLAGGDQVTVAGAGFASGVRVYFGSRPGTHVHVQSGHELTVVAPRHAAGWVHVRVVRGGSTSTARTADRYLYTSPPSRIGWSSWRSIDPDRGDRMDISCPTATFCLAVDRTGGYLTYDGSTWSARKAMPAKNAASVSCSAATTCTAATDDGYVTTWQAGAWSAPHLVDPQRGVEVISCPTTTFCMLIDFEGHYATGHDNSWSAPTREPATFNAQSMDCTSATFCLMVDGNGVTVSWNGSTWHTEATGDKFATALSCATPTFCVTVESYYRGRIYTWNGTSWSSLTLPGEPKVQDVDCVTTTSCVAVGDGGAAWVMSGSTWSSVPAGSRSWVAVSCATTSRCVAVGSRQFATTFDGTSWTTPVVVQLASGFPSDVSCSSTAFCMVVDGSGASVAYVRGTWGAPRTAYLAGRLTAVACPRSSFCLAVGSGGRTVTWNGSAWAAPVAHAGFGIFADVSCASASSCVAVSGNRALHWTGSGWRSTTITGVRSVQALDCPTTTYCLALTYGGYAVSWNGHSWSTARHVASSVLSVACGAARDCYVGTLKSTVVALHGSVWSRPFSLGGAPIVDISCPTTAFCAASAQLPLASFDVPGYTRIPVFRGAAVTTRVAHHNWDIVALSCPTSHFCALADDFGGAVVGTR
jgi:hypothetical protein